MTHTYPTGSPVTRYCTIGQASHTYSISSPHPQEVSGLVIPTTRMIYSSDDNGHKIPEPLVVSVHLEDVAVS